MNKYVKDDSQQEQNVYKMGKLSKIPSWLIFLLLKYWAAAAAVFFTVIGGLDIGLDFSQVPEDQYTAIVTDLRIVVIIALGLALIMSYIVRPIVNMFKNPKDDTYRFNMINLKGFKSFIVCLLYNFVLSFILYFITVFLGSRGLIFNLFGTTNFGIEPFTYGLCYIIVDAFFLLIKNLIIYAYRRYKYNKQLKGEM